jgi:outer membrane biosynthesis protein TonB
MGPLRTSLPVLVLFAAAVTGLAACGGGDDELLPGASASEIKSNLSQVERLVAEEECIGAENSAAEIGSQVEELRGVDAKLKRALAEGATRLTEKVESECVEASEEETAPPVEELEEEEPEKKPKPEKEEKEEEKEQKEAEKEEAEEEPETDEGPTLPPPSNGKGEEKGQGNGPSVEPDEGEGEGESPSGGVGPGVPVDGE